MTDKIARVCDYCGKTDILGAHSDSNGMIIMQGDRVYLVLMCDIAKGESTRPSLNLSGKAYCPDCLPKAISEWAKKAN